MADLFPDHPGYRTHNEHTNYPLSADVQYPPHPQQQQQQHPQQQQQPQQQAPPQPQQQPAPPTSSSSNTPSSPEENSPIQTTPKSELPGTPQPRQEGKQQATFLTKLYALLERPENHHMIRWDPQGEHIIVEKPEQLAIHVLPSVYRQSRFASFSRQLNIYGFMRKVNLRNVDPAIDDPDASTWSHPTLNRHSSAEVVANFKRRVPPRIPKSKKRAEEAAAAVAAAAAQNMAPRGNVGLAPMQAMSGQRTRAYTSPGSFQPLGQPGAVSWGTPYPRPGIPPLDVPSHHAGGGMFTHQPGYGHPPHGQGLPPVEESRGFNGAPYSAPGHLPPASAYPPYPEQSQWQFNGAPGHPGNNSGRDLSSLLNPSSGGGGYQRPPLNTYGAQGFPAMPGAQHSPASPSDSRPNTGYSVASAASVGYDDGTKTFAHDYSRPSSSHHPRQLSPGPASRPGSSHAPPSFQQPSSLSIRRARRHSQAQSPYPHPPGTGGYDGPVGADGRPSTSPPDGHHDHHMSRARSMVALGQPPSSAGGEGAYSYGPGAQNGHGDFAYSAAAIPGAGGEPLDAYSHSVRPSTGASSLSTASQANTPPVTGGTDADINRFAFSLPVA